MKEDELDAELHYCILLMNYVDDLLYTSLEWIQIQPGYVITAHWDHIPHTDTG